MPPGETEEGERATRRAAAAKASRLSAAQLDDSSGDERNGAPAGEPSNPRAQLKSRRRARPLAKSASLPSPAPLSHQHTASSARDSQPGAAPSAARVQSSTARPEALYISSSSANSDDDIILLDTPPPSAKQPARRKRPSEPQKASRAQKRRRCGSAAGASHTGSLATARSSPPPEAGPANARGSRDRTRLAAAARASPPREPRAPAPLARHASAPQPHDARFDALDWDEDVLLVFVRVDAAGAPARDGMWWPAQVVDSRAGRAGTLPLRVAPFGRCPGSPPPRELALPSRGPELVLPYRVGPTRLRFDERTFRAPADALSPRRRRTPAADDGLVARWCEARDLMLKAHEDAHDGMPLLLSRYIGSLAALGGGAGAALYDSSSSSSEDEGARARHVPRAGNVLYDVPGELVLARERRSETQFWPAKLMKYIPPSRPGGKPLYEVLFFEGTVKRLPDNADMFYTPMHDGFKTCKLGEAEDDYDINAGARDEDNDDDEDAGAGLRAVAFEDEPPEALRAASPPPPLPAPTAFAHELGIDAQFAYVAPVLDAVLRGAHGPALPRHVAFMRGGRARAHVAGSAWRRGEVSHADRDALLRCILRWAHRRAARQALGLVPPDVGVVPRAVAPPEGPTAARAEVDPEDTEMEGAPSEAEMPPSSYAAAASTRADSEPVGDGSPPRREQMTTALRRSVDAGDVGEGASAKINEPEVDNTAGDGGRAEGAAAPEPLPTFAMLSPLDQITYCTSVLLPEAILQILLWRNGHRHTPALLPPDEEARLHAIAEESAAATYWVHDIIHMKRSVDRKTLPASAPGPPGEPSARGRLRARRR